MMAASLNVKFEMKATPEERLHCYRNKEVSFVIWPCQEKTEKLISALFSRDNDDIPNVMSIHPILVAIF